MKKAFPADTELNPNNRWDKTISMIFSFVAFETNVKPVLLMLTTDARKRIERNFRRRSHVGKEF